MNIERNLIKRRRQAGFSLIELMVAVAIVAIMMAIITPHLMGASKEATETACTGDSQAIRAALAEYNLLHQSLPSGSSEEQIKTLVAEQLLDKAALNGSYQIDDTDPDNITVTCQSGGAANGTP